MLMERTAQQHQHPEVDDFDFEAYDAYETPLVLHQEVSLIEQEEIVWWAVFIGFSYTVAMAYAAYCTSKGGSPNISFGWKGFKVSCRR